MTIVPELSTLLRLRANRPQQVVVDLVLIAPALAGRVGRFDLAPEVVDHTHRASDSSSKLKVISIVDDLVASTKIAST